MTQFPTQRQYLEGLGVLEHGTTTQIDLAKKEYRKLYNRYHKQEMRKKRKEFHPSFSQEELAILKEASSHHHSSITKYIHDAVLAYSIKQYLVPNEEQIRELEVFLNQIFQFLQRSPEIQTIINHLEQRMDVLLRHPPLCPKCSSLCS